MPMAALFSSNELWHLWQFKSFGFWGRTAVLSIDDMIDLSNDYRCIDIIFIYIYIGIHDWCTHSILAWLMASNYLHGKQVFDILTHTQTDPVDQIHPESDCRFSTWFSSGLEADCDFPNQLGISWSQLTFTYMFFRGVAIQLFHQPDIHRCHRYIMSHVYIYIDIYMYFHMYIDTYMYTYTYI